MCVAAVGARSARGPDKILTTPAGRSLVARISEKVRAGNGAVSEGSRIQVLPVTIVAATR